MCFNSLIKTHWLWYWACFLISSSYFPSIIQPIIKLRGLSSSPCWWACDWQAELFSPLLPSSPPFLSSPVYRTCSISCVTHFLSDRLSFTTFFFFLQQRRKIHSNFRYKKSVYLFLSTRKRTKRFLIHNIPWNTAFKLLRAIYIPRCPCQHWLDLACVKVITKKKSERTSKVVITKEPGIDVYLTGGFTISPPRRM